MYIECPLSTWPYRGPPETHGTGVRKMWCGFQQVKLMPTLQSSMTSAQVKQEAGFQELRTRVTRERECRRKLLAIASTCPAASLTGPCVPVGICRSCPESPCAVDTVYCSCRQTWALWGRSQSASSAPGLQPSIGGWTHGPSE